MLELSQTCGDTSGKMAIVERNVFGAYYRLAEEHLCESALYSAPSAEKRFLGASKSFN